MHELCFLIVCRVGVHIICCVCERLLMIGVHEDMSNMSLSVDNPLLILILMIL